MTTRDYTTDTCTRTGAPLDPPQPMRCGDCDRPTYYDYADEAYHHATDPADGCFLVSAEPDRAEDPRHPLHPDYEETT